MDAYNMKILGLSIKDRLRWHWGLTADKAADCTRCGLCEGKCTQHLPIISRLEEIARHWTG